MWPFNKKPKIKYVPPKPERMLAYVSQMGSLRFHGVLGMVREGTKQSVHMLRMPHLDEPEINFKARLELWKDEYELL